MNSLHLKNQNIKVHHLSLLFMSLIILVVGKDWFHSAIKGYSFYLSESLLFGTFWILFLPLILINLIFFKRKLVFVLFFTFPLLHITLFSLFVYGGSSAFLAYVFNFSGIFLNTIAENGMTCLLVYGIVNFILLERKKKQGRTSNLNVCNKISIADRDKIILLNIDDIIYIKSEKPYIALLTSDKKYLHNSSLKKFLLRNPTESFIRIHKSAIVNSNHIVSFLSRKNGDYDIELSNHHIVRASRSFRINFKSFLDDLNLV